MLFRVLGPLAVERAGPALSALMVRRLLAALLCRPNECVAVEDLLLALWGENAPQASRKTLQVYVRRLRSALGEPRILHEPAGYRIVVGAGELDSAEFAQLVTDAQDAAPKHASALLAEAKKLWRSNAFEDVREHPPIADEARRLDEERIRVEAWHARLQLELGKHAELVPHLTKLIEVHPYREDLRGHLMLALYRSGRQKEALEVFHNTRRLLDDELGVEPGPDLQRLHESILRADPSLELPTRPTTTVPRGLPADITSFVGRTEHLQALDEMLGDSSPIVISAISGSAGIGKTALAVHWAHRVADRFPDGQLYINLRGYDPASPPVGPAEAIRHFLDVLGVASQRIPASPEAQGNLYRSQLAGKRMLLVLDNARDAQQVRALLPGSQNCLTLITSRHQQASLVATHGARPLTLDVLTWSEAHEFLVARLGAHRVEAEPSAAADIIARCARLPLALAVAAAQATIRPHLSLDTLAAELVSADAFASDDPLTDIRAVFSWSYETLAPPAARLFRLLGLHPGPDISIPAAASLAALPTDEVQGLLKTLTDAHLINERSAARYSFHDLLRTYAADLARTTDSADTRYAATGRILDHYLHSAHATHEVLDSDLDPITLGPPQPGTNPEHFTDPKQALTWFTSEHAVLLAMIEHALATGFDTHTWQLARSINSFLDRHGHWHDVITIHHAGVAAAERLADPSAMARAYLSLGSAYRRLDRFSDALTHLQRSLDLRRGAGDLVRQAHVHRTMSNVWERQGRLTEALYHAEQARDLCQAAGYTHGQARALNGVGWCHSLLGDYEQALAACELALTMLLEVGDRYGQALTWDSLGYVRHNLGHHAQAIICYHHAIELFQNLDFRYNVADTLTRLGDTYHTANDPDAAYTAWQRALIIFDELDDPHTEQVRNKIRDLRPNTGGAAVKLERPSRATNR